MSSVNAFSIPPSASWISGFSDRKSLTKQTIAVISTSVVLALIIKVLDSLSTVAADIFVRVRTNGTMNVNPFVEAYNKGDFADSNQLFVRHCDVVFHIPTPIDDEFAADIAINMQTGIPNFAGRKRLNCEEDVDFIRFSDKSWKEAQPYIQGLLDKLDQSKVRYQVLNH